MSCKSDNNLEFENDYSKASTRYINLLIILYTCFKIDSEQSICFTFIIKLYFITII